VTVWLPASERAVLNDARRDVQQRQALLLERSAALRQIFADDAKGLQRPLAVVDRTRDVIRWWAARPYWLVALAGSTLLLRPRRALGWGLRAWSGWRTWRRVQALLQR